MKRVFIMCFIFVIVLVLVGCDTKNKYSDEEHINNISKIIEEKYFEHDVTYKLRPIYNINDKLSYFVVDFSNDTYFYIKIQEKDNSAFFGYSLYTKDTTGKNSGPWKKSKFVEENGITIEQFEKDEIGNDIFYYNSHFEVANIDNNTKCYLIELRNSDNNLIPAIKVGNGYLNLITDSEFDIYTSEKFPSSNIYFLPKSSFNLQKNRNFGIEYQGWYSQALLIIKTFLPERLDEFVSLYQPQKNRKEIDETNYTILDALTNVSSVWIQESAALNKLIVQIQILKSLEEIINSRLDELNIILEFDVFEKELDAAKMLHKNKYYRSAGAICGVLIEKHLTTMLNKRNIKITKKDPCINDLNQLLYTNNIIDLTQTKFLIYMGDIRNKCDHNKKDDPTPEEVSELINGTDKIIKTYS